MSTTSEVKIRPPAIQCIDEHGNPLDGEMRELMITAKEEEYDSYTALHRLIVKELAVEKPSWFKESESEARQLLAGLGHTALGPIHVVTEDEALDELGMGRPITTVAQTAPALGHTLVREVEMTRRYNLYGSREVTAILARELTRLTVEPTPVVTLERTSDTGWTELLQSGLVEYTRDGVKGSFEERMLPSFIAGWARRRADDPDAPLFDPSPSEVGEMKIPNHYLPTIVDKKTGKRGPDVYDGLRRLYVSGPDGYSLELIAQCADERGIAKGEDVIHTLFATGKQVTHEEAVKDFVSILNDIRPGLHEDLRVLPYRKHNLWEGLRRVIAATTDKEKSNG